MGHPLHVHVDGYLRYIWHKDGHEYTPSYSQVAICQSHVQCGEEEKKVKSATVEGGPASHNETAGVDVPAKPELPSLGATSSMLTGLKLLVTY